MNHNRPLPCPRCTSNGIVRVEHVFNGGKSFNVLECAHCSYQWQIAETGEHVPVGPQRLLSEGWTLAIAAERRQTEEAVPPEHERRARQRRATSPPEDK